MWLFNYKSVCSLDLALPFITIALKMCDKPDELLNADQGMGANANSHHSNTYYMCHMDINYILNMCGRICDFMAYSKWVFIYVG